MIGKLKGILEEKKFTSCLIDCNGVGYELQIPLSTFDRLPENGQACTLLVYTQVREDAITLFGFFTESERRLFRLLINVSGIGGKSAVAILSSVSVENFCNAVVSGDLKALSTISGVGKKTAERLLVELKDKLSEVEYDASALPLAIGEKSQLSDAKLALEALGFKREQVDTVLRKINEEENAAGLSSEDILRRAIQILKG